MTSQLRCAWIVCLGLLVCGACKGDVGDNAAIDPLDDPWLDAIDTDEPAPAVVAAAAPLQGAPAAPPNIAEADALAEAQPQEAEAQPSAAVLAAPRTNTATATAPAPAPTQPAPAATASEGPAPEPSPALAPTPAPSVEPAKPPPPPPITAADFDGSYRYAGGSSQRTELEAAIEATIQHLPSALHGIARKRIGQANPVDATVEIRVVGNELTTSFASGFQVTCVIDGAAVRTKGIDGNKLDVSVRGKGSKLVQLMQGRDGARTVVYVLSDDRSRLTVHHKITSPRLPEPLIYRLSFARK